MDNILRIGTLLMKAKEQLFRYGQWLHWLQYNVDISVRHAERYMQLAKAYSNSTLVSNLTTTFRKACVEKLSPLHERVHKLLLSAQKGTE